MANLFHDVYVGSDLLREQAEVFTNLLLGSDERSSPVWPVLGNFDTHVKLDFFLNVRFASKVLP